MSRSLDGLFRKQERLIVGLMSGTSLDGVDAVIARLEGSGRGMSIEVIASSASPYPDDLRRLILANSAPEGSSVLDIPQLNVRIAREYATVVLALLEQAGFAPADIAAIGSHGQTIHHVPNPTDCAGVPVISTLQIGDPATLAAETGIPVISDFRAADMAHGGQGAPLVPYFDFVAFAHDSQSRGLLNLGGIANITVLPAGCDSRDVVAFDTGPANMVIDGLMNRFFGEPFDNDGRRAAAGNADDDLLVWLLTSDPYLDREPPKSTGREHYDERFVDELVRRGRSAGLPDNDILATATAFTALSVYQAYARFLRADHPIDVLIVAGGGRKNPVLMRKLADSFAPIRIEPIDDHGIESDVKEALCFAVLAHEFLERRSDWDAIRDRSPHSGNARHALTTRLTTVMQDQFTPINAVGEFGLIDRISTILGSPTDEEVLLGIADDAAVYRIDDGRVHVVTTDGLIEGVHFDRLFMPMQHLGFKAISVNVSDVVAMNAAPRFATIALGIPNTVSVEMIEDFYKGARRACETYDLTIIGGDTMASRHLTITVTIIGEARTEEIVFRRGARPGDLLCVTGDLGSAYAGLKVLLAERAKMREQGEDYRPELGEFQEVIQRQLMPTARLDVVNDWVRRGVKPAALIDVSDGLASEIHHICTQSDCGALLHVAAIPIAFETRDVADHFEDDVDSYARFGGEDYELLFAISKEDSEKLDQSTFNVIGEFTDASFGVQAQTPEGDLISLTPGGFDHFGEGEQPENGEAV